MTIKSNNLINNNSQILSMPQNNFFTNPTFYFELGGPQLTKNTAYFIFLGVVIQTFTPLQVYIPYNSAGTGTVSHAIGLWTTTSIPAAGNLTMTPVQTTSTITSDATNSLYHNTSNFSTSVAAGSNLWAAYIPAFGTNQTSVTFPWIIDAINGSAQTKASSSVATFTGGGTIAATAVLSNATIVPTAFLIF